MQSASIDASPRRVRRRDDFIQIMVRFPVSRQLSRNAELCCNVTHFMEASRQE
jgi:hypothetical protein